MKRLEESSLLASLLSSGSIDDSSINAIARKISDFHKGAERSDKITATGGTETVVFNTEEDFQQVGPYIGETLTMETFVEGFLVTTLYRVGLGRLNDVRNGGQRYFRNYPPPLIGIRKSNTFVGEEKLRSSVLIGKS